jgi:hypothetical protein
MEIIEILSQNKADQAIFTVDTHSGALAVDIVQAASTRFVNGYGANKFVSGDNVLILSMGVTLPYNFQFAPMPDSGVIPEKNTGAPRIFLDAELSPSGIQAILNQLGSSGFILLPMENYEIALNSFIGDTASWKSNFYLRGTFPPPPAPGAYAVPQISMIGVPAAYDTMVLPINLFIKILHTKPMTV